MVADDAFIVGQVDIEGFKGQDNKETHGILIEVIVWQDYINLVHNEGIKVVGIVIVGSMEIEEDILD